MFIDSDACGPGQISWLRMQRSVSGLVEMEDEVNLVYSMGLFNKVKIHIMLERTDI